MRLVLPLVWRSTVLLTPSISITDDTVEEERTNTSLKDVCKTKELGVTPVFSKTI
jgi:hypothetical protein